MTPLIELREVTKVYGGGMLSKGVNVALHELSLTIQGEQPQIIAVVGESGSGKTTLASLIMGFIQPNEGEVLYKGKDLRKLSGKDYFQFRREVQAVFQDPFAAYNPFYKVDHVLSVPIKKFGLTTSKSEAREMMERALSTVGLRPEETLGRFPHQLSGGQRQRIIVARAVMLNPRLIVADEPVSMVDASLRATILESLRNVNQTLGLPILYITHDLGTAYHVSDHIIVMYRGTVAEAGDVESVIRNPKHPYTQLLIDSIPWPDPDRRWGQPPELGGGRIGVPEQHPGCIFAARCPYVMETCLESPPPLFRTERQHGASCYLHRSHPALPAEDLSLLLEPAAATPRVTA
ncbi:MAG TPA: ABC transporter ATP-binding protein [Herpetosiphonaceae bacterium]|nr:ABC transporter ATP-binding protein [Herpetosiphonaceae bacterium]